MSSSEDDKKKTLSLSEKILKAKKSDEKDKIRQSFSHGRSKTVTFEVKKKTFAERLKKKKEDSNKSIAQTMGLTEHEWEARKRAVQEAALDHEEKKRKKEEEESQKALAQATAQEQASKEKLEETALETEPTESTSQDPVVPDVVSHGDDAPLSGQEEEVTFKVIKTLPPKIKKPPQEPVLDPRDEGETAPAKFAGHSKKFTQDEEGETDKGQKNDGKRRLGAARRSDVPKGRLTRMAMEGGDGDEDDSLGRSNRMRRMGKKKRPKPDEEKQKVIREVIIPEVITVQELSNRMAVRAADVVKMLMQMGTMATMNQSIDAETAELIVTEFGHTPKKVSMADVEVAIEDDLSDVPLVFRAPVVTVMGHVDHGKTSLLDAIRSTDTISGEAGGITQHIGAYQVALPSGQKVTFIDTPGHAAFTEMRSRGANVTDVVVLVVAADDGIKEQTIEALNHAKAAKVPMIVAINKIDKPAADVNRVRNELLQHDLVVEELGGDIMAVEVSAKNRQNISGLLDAILVQAEVMDLKAPKDCRAQGVVIESKVEKGKGATATVLIQKGTLEIGDIFVAGSESGRVRAIMDDHGHRIKQAGPSQAVEILGFTGAPSPGDPFSIVPTESQAREVATFRMHQEKESKIARVQKTSIDSLFAQSKEGAKKELAVIIKSDVQGSVEAIQGSLMKLETDEVGVKVLHTGVGAINESDISLANASDAMIVAFNVRANPQAKEMAQRDGIEIRYYSVIYDVIDDIKALMSGLLSPVLSETFLGYAEIRNVFNLSKFGKIAGCMVTQGVVKRGVKVRLLRDNVVIHEGDLKSLRRFKDEVKEAREGYECGIALESYQDIRVGDIIECFEVVSKAREL